MSHTETSQDLMEKLVELMTPIVRTIGDAMTDSGYSLPRDWKEWPRSPWRLTLPTTTYRLYRIISGFDDKIPAGGENHPLRYLMFRGMRVVDGGPDMAEPFVISRVDGPKDIA